MSMSPYTIVEGVIGCGKSTIVRELSAAMNKKLPEGKETLALFEPDEKKGNPFLALYYDVENDGPKRWGAFMQAHLLHGRYSLHELAQWWCINEKGPAIMDRSYYGDTCFARMLAIDGVMNPDEFWSYAQMFKKMQPKVAHPNVCIRVLVDPTIAANRVRKRYERDQKTRDFEKKLVTPEYNANLDKQIDRMCGVLERMGVKVYDLPWDMDRDGEDDRRVAVESMASRILSHEPPDFFTDLYRRTT